MSGKKHAFLLFTKAPAPGVTKTRLTEARGGILTPEEAADFYRAKGASTAVTLTGMISS